MRHATFRDLARSVAAALTTASLLWTALPAHALLIGDLYGTWRGTWFVDAYFSSIGAPLPLPAEPDAALEFRLHAFDPTSQDYGDVFIEGAISGKVTRIDVSGSSVAMQITYPLMGIAEPKGFITSTYSGGWLRGDYDETPPMPAGWIGWRGPFELQLASPVPELPTPVLLCAGACGLAAALRRRRVRSASAWA